MEEELIEINDNELFLGDQHLKIDSSNVTEKKTEDTHVVSEGDIKEDENLLEVLDEVISTSDNEEIEEVNEEVLENTKEEVTKETSSESEETEEELNAFSAWATSLADKGFFPDVNEEDIKALEDEDGVSDLLAKQLNTTFGQWKDQYKNNLINNLIAEGKINQSDVKNLPQIYSEEDIKASVDVAKSAIEKYYKRIGTPDSEIKRIIDSREDLEESALELNKLNADLDAKEQSDLASRLKQQEDLAAQQKVQFAETLKNNTFEYEEFIPGRKLKKKDKEDVFMNIEPTLNKINSDLGKYGPLLSYLDRYGMLDGKFDKVLKEGATKQTSKFAKILAEKPRKSTGTSHRKREEGSPNIDDSDVRSIYQ